MNKIGFIIISPITMNHGYCPQSVHETHRRDIHIKEKLVFKARAKGERKVIWLVGWGKTSWETGHVSWVL